MPMLVCIINQYHKKIEYREYRQKSIFFKFFNKPPTFFRCKDKKTTLRKKQLQVLYFDIMYLRILDITHNTFDKEIFFYINTLNT